MQKNINMKVNSPFIAIIVILTIAFCWQLFFTYGFDFFGEDFDVFHVYWEKTNEYQIFKDKYLPKSIQPSMFTLTLGIGKEYIREFFVPHRLFQVGFKSYSQTDRPYQFLTWDLLKVFFGKKAKLYRVFKAVIFAINTCVIYLIISRISNLFAMLGALLYMTSAEIWLSALYLNNLGLLAQGATIISIFLFIKLTEKIPLRYKDVWLYYLLILLVSNVAVLTFGDARYLAIILFLTILFFRKKDLKLLAPGLIVLFLLQFPILGYFKKLFLDRAFSPVNLTSHVNTSPSVLSTLYWTISNYRFTVNALGLPMLILLFVPIGAYLFFKPFQILLAVFRKNKSSEAKQNMYSAALKERLLLFALWFICSSIMVAKVRNFRYGSDPISFMLYDLAYFIAPFIMFVCYYIALLATCNTKRIYQRFFLILSVCLILSQLILNVNRLNKFREKGGVKICAWRNAEKFVESSSGNALALALTTFQYKPFVFYESDNSILSTQASCEQSEFCDLSYIEAKFDTGSYDDIFVLGNKELTFDGSSEVVTLVQKTKISSDSGDLYDRLKRRLGHKFKNVINLYHFKLKKQTT